MNILEKQSAQSFDCTPVWTQYATCGSRELLERVRMGQPNPEQWRVSQLAPLENHEMEKGSMIDAKIARPLELELQKLLGETSYRLEVRSCTGKYLGHTDYTLVFGSGRRLYIGLDERNYINSLQEKLRAIRHFRAHQAENTQRINAVLSEHGTPFEHAEVEILPYTGTSDLTLYAVVILSANNGIRFVYRTTAMHGCLVGYKGACFDFDACMGHMIQDVYGKMAYTHMDSKEIAA